MMTVMQLFEPAKRREHLRQSANVLQQIRTSKFQVAFNWFDSPAVYCSKVPIYPDWFKRFIQECFSGLV